MADFLFYETMKWGNWENNICYVTWETEYQGIHIKKLRLCHVWNCIYFEQYRRTLTNVDTGSNQQLLDAVYVNSNKQKFGKEEGTKAAISSSYKWTKPILGNCNGRSN